MPFFLSSATIAGVLKKIEKNDILSRVLGRLHNAEQALSARMLNMRQELPWLSSLQRFPTQIGPCNDVVAMSAMAGLGNFVQDEKYVVYDKLPKVASFLTNNFLYQFH